MISPTRIERSRIDIFLGMGWTLLMVAWLSVMLAPRKLPGASFGLAATLLYHHKAARRPLDSNADSYPHVTNGGEKQDERPEASVCKESQPFQMVRQPGGPSWERTARGDNRPEPPDQAVNRRPLPFFNATAACEALVIVLDQPAMPIPVHALPRLFERGGGHRGKPHPFQWLLALWSFLFPDADDPHGQRLLARSWGISRWQERHLTKGKLQLGRTRRMTMPSRNLERTTRLAGKGPCLRQRRADLFLAHLDAS